MTAANVRKRGTTSAIDTTHPCRSVYFDHVVSDGEIVEVDGRRMVVYYDPQAPDWFASDPADESERLRCEVRQTKEWLVAAWAERDALRDEVSELKKRLGYPEFAR